jgi:hypothetical protein
MRPWKKEYRDVWEGRKVRTTSGLTKNDLTRNPKTGAIVSKAKRAIGLKMMNNPRIKNSFKAHRAAAFKS